MIEQIRRLLVGLALAGYTGCASGGGGQPPQPPTPPDPTPQCVEGQACACWHRPPEALGWLYACCQPGIPGGVVNVQDPAQCIQQPLPTPTCPEACPTGQHCTDPAVGCVPKPPVPPDPPTGECMDEDELTTPKACSEEMRNVVKNATDALGPLGPDCTVNLKALAAKIRQQTGKCALGGIEAVFIRRDDGLAEENHACFFGNGQWINGGYGKFVGCHTGAGTTPPPDPPPTGGCSAPLPPKVWTAETLPDGWGQDEIGKPRWLIGCSPHNRVIDCTPNVAPRACDYCDSIGMGTTGDGQLRCGCPVRNECKPTEQTPPQNFKCEERMACEQYLSGGTTLEARNGATCDYTGSNPFQFKPNDGNCRLCSAADPRVCGGWF